MLPLTMLITFSWNSLWGEEHRLLLSCWQSLPSQGLSGSSWLEKISGVARYDVDDIVLVHCWSKKFLCLFRVFMAPASNYYYFLYFYWWIPEHCQVLRVKYKAWSYALDWGTSCHVPLSLFCSHLFITLNTERKIY